MNVYFLTVRLKWKAASVEWCTAASVPNTISTNTNSRHMIFAMIYSRMHVSFRHIPIMFPLRYAGIPIKSSIICSAGIGKLYETTYTKEKQRRFIENISISTRLSTWMTPGEIPRREFVLEITRHIHTYTHNMLSSVRLGEINNFGCASRDTYATQTFRISANFSGSKKKKMPTSTPHFY